MKEFMKSMFGCSLALSLFGLKQMANILTPSERGAYRGPATKAFDSVTHCTIGQFGSTMRSTFSAVNNLQRGMVDVMFGMLFPWTLPGGSRRQSMPLETGVPDYTVRETVIYADIESRVDVSDPVRPRRV
jgi:hypothetical protein